MFRIQCTQRFFSLSLTHALTVLTFTFSRIRVNKLLKMCSLVLYYSLIHLIMHLVSVMYLRHIKCIPLMIKIMSDQGP